MPLLLKVNFLLKQWLIKIKENEENKTGYKNHRLLGQHLKVENKRVNLQHNGNPDQKKCQ